VVLRIDKPSKCRVHARDVRAQGLNGVFDYTRTH
jgi:hypothetical protein